MIFFHHARRNAFVPSSPLFDEVVKTLEMLSRSWPMLTWRRGDGMGLWSGGAEGLAEGPGEGLAERPGDGLAPGGRDADATATGLGPGGSPPLKIAGATRTTASTTAPVRTGIQFRDLRAISTSTPRLVTI